MKCIVVAVIALVGMNGVALAAAEESEFWTALFWNLLNFIASSGGMWQL